MTKSLGAVLAAALLGTLPLASEAATLTRCPYLQQPTQTSIIVVFRTAEATAASVRYGTSPDRLDRTATGAAGVTQHEIQLAGLSPDTAYYYQLEADGAPLGQPAKIHTAPPTDTTKPIRLWLIGDNGSGTERQFQVRDQFVAATRDHPADLMLHSGDIGNPDGTDADFQDYFFNVYPDQLRELPVWPVMSNHDGASAKSATQSGPYYDNYVLPTKGEAGGVPSGTEAYYSFDYGPVHFVMLDSYDSPREGDGAMARWLEADLAATKARWIVAQWHHSPYSKGSHDSDEADSAEMIQMREIFNPILETAGVDLVVGGHSHSYERTHLVAGAFDTPTVAEGHILDPGNGQEDGDGAYHKTAGVAPGTVYVVAGHGGKNSRLEGVHPLMAHAEGDNGSCIVDVDQQKLTLRNIRWDGVETDHFTIVKDGGQPPPADSGGTGGAGTGGTPGTGTDPGATPVPGGVDGPGDVAGPPVPGPADGGTAAPVGTPTGPTGSGTAGGETSTPATGGTSAGSGCSAAAGAPAGLGALSAVGFALLRRRRG